MIKQFSENGPVGVLKPCCTMLNVDTRQSATKSPMEFEMQAGLA